MAGDTGAGGDTGPSGHDARERPSGGEPDHPAGGDGPREHPAGGRDRQHPTADGGDREHPGGRDRPGGDTPAPGGTRRAGRRAGEGWDGYAARWERLHGGYDPRQAAPLVQGWLKAAYQVARLLAVLRVPPNAVTAAGVVLAAPVVVFALMGFAWPVVGAVVVVLGAFADTVDGALAVVRRRISPLGQVYDAVADRLTEAAWLLALWSLNVPGWLLVGCGALSWLHEYVRARATGAGMREIGVVTLGERPTRVLVTAFGLVMAGLAGLAGPELAAGVATVAAAIWMLLAGMGLVQLAAAVYTALRRLPADQADGADDREAAGPADPGRDERQRTL